MPKIVTNKIHQLNEFPSYKGGDTCIVNGYIFEYLPSHHLANGWGWIAQHRLIGEDIVGRRLVQSKNPKLSECVHHIDECKTNNSIDNLEVLTMSEHRSHHAKSMNEPNKKTYSEADIVNALKGRTIKQASAILGCTHMTLRRNHPDMIHDRKRSSPNRIDAEKTADLIRPFAESDKFSIVDASRIIHISPITIVKACRHHGISWVHKARPGRPKRSTPN